MEKEVKKRTFKISEGLKPYIEQVMLRDRISYRFIQDNRIETNLSGNAFHIVVEDALCEKQRGDSRNIPVYSYRTVMNSEKFRRLRRINRMNSFRILSKDSAKYNRRIEGRR